MAAVDVDSEHPKILAAICLSSAARRAISAKIIGLDGAHISGGKMRTCRSGNDFHAKLMSQPARITEERLLSGQGMEVGAAHAATMNANESIALLRGRLRDVDPRQLAGFFKRRAVMA